MILPWSTLQNQQASLPMSRSSLDLARDTCAWTSAINCLDRQSQELVNFHISKIGVIIGGIVTGMHIGWRIQDGNMRAYETILAYVPDWLNISNIAQLQESGAVYVGMGRSLTGVMQDGYLYMYVDVHDGEEGLDMKKIHDTLRSLWIKSTPEGGGDSATASIEDPGGQEMLSERLQDTLDEVLAAIPARF